MATEQIKYLDEAAAARTLNVSRRTLQRWRNSGEGVPYVRIGVRRVGYDTTVIAAWVAGRTYSSRAAEMAGQRAHA